ncbi:hypothetical protein KC19_9G018900 [Ceratodon purpureus]|uniref:Uncharacterized protein n=1 Tax=Ceratodon purpureus TaxID=3225 RepID=A0A8T0GMT3_CERPU|nr:hypothetical protein KC19_9G018900 [Ceratodon purpureus]
MPSQVGKVESKKRVSQTYCQKQRVVKCNALEPVLEHGEAPSEKTSSACESAPKHACDDSQPEKRGKPMRMLMKLRDGYVKLMNDLSSGADLSGASSFYGCTGTDYPIGAMANSRLMKEDQEREIMIQAMQTQLAHSRQITTTMT